MDSLALPADAKRALRRYLNHAENHLPAETFALLEPLVDSPSPVDVVVKATELLYAYRGQLDAEGRTIVAQLASFAAVNAWHGLADENRGGRIAQAMLRDNGDQPEAGQPPFPEAEMDPAPHPAYAPPPPPPALPA